MCESSSPGSFWKQAFVVPDKFGRRSSRAASTKRDARHGSHRCRQIPVVADDYERKQSVFLLRAPADVVHDKRHTVLNLVGNQSDMRPSVGQAPGDNVPGFVVGGHRRDGQTLTVPCEENAQVENPPVIDIRIGLHQSPSTRIGAESLTHVLIDEKLQVYPYRPVSPHDDIGAHSPVHRHIAAWKWNGSIGRIVIQRHPDLLMRSLDELAGEGSFIQAESRRGDCNQESAKQPHLGETSSTGKKIGGGYALLWALCGVGWLGRSRRVGWVEP